jgi:cell division protein FtsB
VRDIGRRIQRYRLGRYAAPEDRLRRNLRWVWVGVALWVVWVGFLSDHSLWRLWRLRAETASSRTRLERTQAEIARLEAESHDPRARRERAERVMRERNGMAKPGEIIYRIDGEPPDTLVRRGTQSSP